MHWGGALRSARSRYRAAPVLGAGLVSLLLSWALPGGAAEAPVGDGSSGSAGAAERADAVAGPDGRCLAGEWLTEGGKGRVGIYPATAGVYEGRIVSGEEGHGAPRDSRNPDPALRGRPVKGIVFMTGFRYAGEGRYEAGRIYDPQSGRTYRGRLRLTDPDTLQLRGFLGISLFGSSQTWKRLTSLGCDSAQTDAGPLGR